MAGGLTGMLSAGATMVWELGTDVVDRIYGAQRPICLEPLSTIFRLAMLAFKPVGTKIKFSAYSFVSIEPGNGQSSSRTVRGDIHHHTAYFLENPVRNAVQIYSKNPEPHTLKVFYWSIIGLKKLQKT